MQKFKVPVTYGLGSGHLVSVLCLLTASLHQYTERISSGAGFCGEEKGFNQHILSLASKLTYMLSSLKKQITYITSEACGYLPPLTPALDASVSINNFPPLLTLSENISCGRYQGPVCTFRARGSLKPWWGQLKPHSWQRCILVL